MTSRLQLFGTPALICDGAPVTFQRRKAMALLAYLAVTRTAHHRDALATMLWPESSSKAAHSALRNLLWLLRGTAMSPHVESDRQIVRLREADEWSADVNRFRELAFQCPGETHRPDGTCAACEPLLAEAARLFRGPFMRGYTVANSVEFDDWQTAEGEALRRELIEVLRRLVEHHAADGAWAEVIDYARRWLEVDRFSERALRALMQAQGTRGEKAEALRAFETCSRQLHEVFGATPEAETQDLARWIRSSRGEMHSGERKAKRKVRLPGQASRIVGRQEMSKRIESLLLDSATNAVCLVGLGGAGKTTLAVHMAHLIEEQFEQGAVYVALDGFGVDAPPADGLLASTVRTALGISSLGSGSSRPIELADAIQDWNVLLVLDGVEHLVPQTIQLVGKFQAAPAVRVLMTSRVEINAEGIMSVPVHGLEIPPADAPPGSLAESPAIRLLRLVAQRHGNPIEDKARELQGMARVAQQVDGSPLGLELAAGWRSALTWDEIADRIAMDPQFLVHRDSAPEAKHRSLAVVFEQTWTMLSPEAQQVLRRLAVFRGPFSAQAAEAVAGGNPGSLATLVQRGLLLREGPTTYRMQELLRQFAHRRLESDAAEAEQAGARHVGYYARSLARWYEALKGPEQLTALRQMEDEIANIRHAFQRAAIRGDHDSLRASCVGLMLYYLTRTALSEAETVFSAAYHAYEEHTDRDAVVEAFLRITSGHFATWDRLDIASRRLDEGIRVLPDVPPKDDLHAMANLIYADGCFSRERAANLRRARESLTYYRSAGDVWGEAFALAEIASIEGYHDRSASEEYAKQSLRLRREIDDRAGVAVTQFALARLAEANGDLELALSRYEEAGRMNVPFSNDGFGGISVLIAQARVLAKLGRAEESARYASQAIRRGHETGYKFQIGRSLIELGRTARAMGALEDAKGYLSEAFATVAKIRWHELQAACARLLVRIALDEKDLGAAEQWLQEAAALDPDHEEMKELTAALEKLRSSECK